ncbi:hypothetical protein GCM10023165_45850 [Variovorax defluvii]|uniref:Uncharacterized protein n=1 Tax=Variovorax defluvii TaxID=913761 RepID=A0ABP8IA34_9BURK
MKRTPAPGPSGRRARRSRGRSGAAAGAAANSPIPSKDSNDTGPSHGWSPDRSDIERANERPGGSIEAVSSHADPGGIEAPEELRDTQEPKGVPFE